MGFLVGRIMKATSGRAEPRVVQEVLSERFAMSTIEVYSFGGAIAGRRQEDGLVVPGDLMSLTSLFETDAELPEGIRFEELNLGQFLSEEITPADWATLITRTAASLEEGRSRGIVVGHGTDTLSYTSSLLYWFFADTTTPLVLTAATVPTETGARSDAVQNLRRAVRTAAGTERGIHVIYGTDDFYPLNLKFEHSGYTARGDESGESYAG
jgi:aspartyl-tRNA(Asn)/glutamyl-tRNA(Gln) amidotransferase subunit B